MIWNNPGPPEYPGVQVYAQKLKQTIMSAHDSMIVAQVKQTRDANQWRHLSPIEKGDLVYLSTKNISFPKGLARKFLPKFMGPYWILDNFGNNLYQLELLDWMKQCRIHDMFHLSYLCIHLPNDDRLFPGWLDNQVAEFKEEEHEWAIDQILSHKGTQLDTVFQIKWKSGDVTWLLLRSYSRGIGSEGLWPQLICCAPFPSIAPYFRILYVSYAKIRMAIVAYPKVWTTIVWYPGI
jgi:hypothetical protein